MKIARKLLAVLVLLMTTASAWAQLPQIWKYANSDMSFLGKMSDNGKWIVTEGTTQNPATATLINVSTKKTQILNSNSDIITTTADVTNDGNIVVGSYDGKAAYWSAKTKQWTMLPTRGTTDESKVKAVTPDGKYAVGVCISQTYYRNSAFWDLQTNRLIDTPNLPDIAYNDFDQIDFRGISPDGKKIWGHTATFDFVYDVEKAEFKLVGYSVANDGLVMPKYERYETVQVNSTSNNFKYFAGNAYYFIPNEDGGEETGEGIQYWTPFVYDVEKDEITFYDDDFAKGNLCNVVSNDGLPFLSSPYGNYYRDWSVYTGKYWVSFENIMKQLYNISFKTQYGYDNTGTFYGIADDNQTTVANPDFYGGDGGYICKWPKPLNEILAKVKVLGSYTASPTEGIETSALNDVTLTFDRNIETTLSSKSSTALLEDGEGNVIAKSIRFKTDGNTLSIAFKNVALDAGESFYVHIPADAIQMANDPEQTNADIYVEYMGRENSPVQLEKVNPVDGGDVAKVDVNTSPITLTFNTDVKIDMKETRKAIVYRNDETEPYAQLNFYFGDQRVVLAPSIAINLIKGDKYRIVVPAGIITDQGGNGGNEEITITYNGAYEREISAANENIFFNDFQNSDLYSAFMLYDGDRNVPTAAMKSWGFTKSQPWWLVKTSSSSDNYAVASHSMYSPAGQSDDWMSTHQLYIPDENCTLEFQSQSYLKGANDRLKVYVWPCNRVYNSLTQDVVAAIKEEGTLVFDEAQNPGKSEEELEGDWKQNIVSLKEFAGQDVYVAFLNDNNNQSAVFVDSVIVKHNMNILVGVDVDETVVNKASVPMKGIIVGNNKSKVYDNITLTLKDEDGKVIEKKELKNQNLAKNVRKEFEFDAQLPLKSGVINRYTIEVSSDGETFSTSGRINNLKFAPQKHVLVEEFTGRDCPNCPLGILGIEKLEERFGDKVIPVAIHGYTGDPLLGGLSSYCAYLNFSAAPSACINRKSITYPAASVTIDNKPEFFFSAKEYEQKMGTASQENLWQDVVEEEISLPALSDISAQITYDVRNNQFIVPFEVKYALNAEGQNVSVLGMLLEDNVNNVYQQNNLGGYSTSSLGEWGQGGKYSDSYVQGYLSQDVCRGLAGETFNGTTGIIPQTVVAGENYTGKLTMPVPTTIADVNNCKMAVVMIDANTGYVINATLAKMGSGDASGITGVSAADSGMIKVYNMQGMLVRKAAGMPEALAGLHGFYIVNGKKMLLK